MWFETEGHHFVNIGNSIKLSVEAIGQTYSLTAHWAGGVSVVLARGLDMDVAEGMRLSLIARISDQPVVRMKDLQI